MPQQECSVPGEQQWLGAPPPTGQQGAPGPLQGTGGTGGTRGTRDTRGTRGLGLVGDGGGGGGARFKRVY